MLKKSGCILFCSIILFNACTKKQNAEVDNETQSVLDFSNTSRDFISVISGVHQALVYTPGTGANQTKTGLAACQLLTKVSGDTLWGTVGHVNPTYSLTTEKMFACNSESLIPHNKNNLSELRITLTDKIQSTGASAIIKIFGRWIQIAEGEAANAPTYIPCDSIILKTLSSDANAATFEMTLVNGKIIQDITGKTSKLTLNVKLQSNINNVNEPYISYSGVAKGVNINGLPYTATISQNSPIIKSKSCYYYKSGNADLTPDGFKNRIIDYGSGKCDDEANFKVNGNTIAFKLK